jgi:hypothetical protein
VEGRRVYCRGEEVMSLLSNAKTNAKTKKMLDEFGYEAVIHYMAPHTVADGRHSVCPYSTEGCRDSCLYTAGRGAMRMVQNSRINKTLEFLKDKQAYAYKLTKELLLLEMRALNKGYTPVARLNGTSDIKWEDYITMEAMPNIQFYDYTKNFMRMVNFLAGESPHNYHLTFSFSEYTGHGDLRYITRKGGNVAVVFREEIPKYWRGYKVASGMEHDFRFRDEKGVIIGLLARGRAKHDDTGFVVD